MLNNEQEEVPKPIPLYKLRMIDRQAMGIGDAIVEVVEIEYDGCRYMVVCLAGEAKTVMHRANCPNHRPAE